MGCIWRCSKSKLVRKIRQAKTKEERLLLRPDNVKTTKEWNKFVELKMSKEFKLRSEKFKSMKDKQIPHTCSRRGMARLTEDLKAGSANPSAVSRVNVWIKSRTRKNGEPLNTNIADTIEKIKKIENESQSSSIYNFKEDALSQVLGQDRSGRLRGMGRGMTTTKAVFLQIKDNQVAQCQRKISELEQLVHTLMKHQGKESCGEESILQMSKHSQIGDNCSLLNWDENDDEIVAEGNIISSDPKELFNEVPLGPNAKKILVVHPKKLDAFLWRPSPGLVHIGDSKDEMVAWPVDRIVIRKSENSAKENESKTSSMDTKCKLYDWGGSKELVAEGRVCTSDQNQIINGIPLGPNASIVWVDYPKKEDAFLWRPIVGMTCIGEAVGKKIAWSGSKLVIEDVDTTTSHTPVINVSPALMSKNCAVNTKCKLIDVEGTGKIVAEGTLSSTNPTDLVHSVPLGPNAVRVWVDVVKIPNAPLWRPTSYMECILDAFGSTVAWPTANIRVDSTFKA